MDPTPPKQGRIRLETHHFLGSILVFGGVYIIHYFHWPSQFPFVKNFNMHNPWPLGRTCVVAKLAMIGKIVISAGGTSTVMRHSKKRRGDKHRSHPLTLWPRPTKTWSHASLEEDYFLFVSLFWAKENPTILMILANKSENLVEQKSLKWLLFTSRHPSISFHFH